jgi:hypothetical protein
MTPLKRLPNYGGQNESNQGIFILCAKRVAYFHVMREFNFDL